MQVHPSQGETIHDTEAIAGWMLTERCKQRLLKRKWGRR